MVKGRLSIRKRDINGRIIREGDIVTVDELGVAGALYCVMYGDGQFVLVSSRRPGDKYLAEDNIWDACNLECRNEVLPEVWSFDMEIVGSLSDTAVLWEHWNCERIAYA